MLDRQVSITGTAHRLTALEVMKYFHSRPKDSQIAAWVSHQSARISTRGILESKFLELKQKFLQGEIPLPSFWGATGYRWRPLSSGRGAKAAYTIAFYISVTGMAGKLTAWRPRLRSVAGDWTVAASAIWLRLDLQTVTGIALQCNFPCKGWRGGAWRFILWRLLSALTPPCKGDGVC